MRNVSHPANTFTIEESMELERMVEMRETEKLTNWCVQNGERLALAVKAWTALEELLRRAHIAELGWWNESRPVRGEALPCASQHQGI